MSLAERLVGEYGTSGAAHVLRVDPGALSACLDRGVPSRRVRAALERFAASQENSDRSETLADLEAGLRALRERIDDIDASVGEALSRAADAAGFDPGQRVSTEQVRDLVARVSRLEREFEGGPERLYALEEVLAALAGRVEALDVIDAEITEGLDNVIALVERETVAMGGRRVDELAGMVEGLSARAEASAGHDGRIQSLESGVRDLERRVGDLDADVRGRLDQVLEMTELVLVRCPADGEGQDGEQQTRDGPASIELTQRQVVTLHGVPDEDYGAGTKLVTEWRRIRDHRSDGSRLEKATIRERVMELEIEMLDGHGLTLPPESEPLHPARRVVQIGWRRRELHSLRIERARLQVVQGLMSALTLGLWRR